MNNVQSYKTPNLTIIDGQVKTTSVAIAELFGKNHKDVLRAIDNLECSTEFAGRNFALSSYRGMDNAGVRCFDITRDGMVFLIMGFTGQNAAMFKEAYILAFNKMEAELLELRLPRKARKPRQIQQPRGLNARQHTILSCLGSGKMHVDEWRVKAYAIIGGSQNTNKTAFRDSRLRLLELGKVNTHDGFYWIL